MGFSSHQTSVRSCKDMILSICHAIYHRWSAGPGACLSEVIKLCLQPHAGDHHHVVTLCGNTIVFFYETIEDHQRGSPGRHECADLAESASCHSFSDTDGRLSCYDCQCRRGICAGGVGSEKIVPEKVLDVLLM